MEISIEQVKELLKQIKNNTLQIQASTNNGFDNLNKSDFDNIVFHNNNIQIIVSQYEIIINDNQ